MCAVFHTANRRSCQGSARANVGAVAAVVGKLGTRERAPIILPVLPLLMVLFFCWSIWGCGASRFDGVEYRDRQVAFRLGALPEGMRQVETDEARIALQNDTVGATVAVGARCGQKSDDVPLQALVQHLFLQFEDKKVISEEQFVLNSRAALRSEVVARLDGVKRHFVVVVMKKNRCVYDFLHVDGGGDAPALRKSRRDFDEMIQGFVVLEEP